MNRLRRLIERVRATRDQRLCPYRIMARMEGEAEAHCWDYCQTPAQALQSLLWWQKSLCEKGFEICSADTFWVVLHVPNTAVIDLTAPAAHSVHKRHLALTIINLTTATQMPSNPATKPFARSHELFSIN